MGGRLFVTGASGYVGRHVVRAATAAGVPVTALLRHPSGFDAFEGLEDADLELVSGDLLVPGDWTARIGAEDVVLHLAAATGKARADEHRRINVEGTRALLAAASARRAAHFVYISSIAVRFPDQKHYPYAHTKSEAEQVVREGAMAWTIVRPTIVVGPGAPVLHGFALLAGLPLTPVFGSGRRRVQPIDVGDLAAALVEVCGDPASGETLELGGPESLTLDAWMQRIRAARGQGPARIVHLPLSPIRALLAWLEPLLLPVLPLTAGQLASFANDGVAEPNPMMEARAPTLRPLDESLAAPEATRLPAAPYDEAALTAECRAFCEHLVGSAPPARVMEGYLAHHRAHPVGPYSGFEHELLERARRGGFAAALADAYAARVLPGGLLRRKLTLLLALLETDPATFERIDAPDSGGVASAWLRLIARGASEIGLALLALAIWGPLHFMAARRES